MTKEPKRLPVFGVGPMYVITCLCLTLAGLILHYKGYLQAGYIESMKIPCIVVGVLFIILGVWLWVQSVIIQSISKEITQGKLVTNGVYAIVRNPIYSAFLFIFSGVLLFASNYFLLVLPFIFFVFLTLLMKHTEERWLTERFGKEYVDYCHRVNRVIPWFPKNKNAL